MASELQVNTITEATSGSGITFAKDIIPATALSHRNIIINGGMNVYQRGSLSITQSNNGGYALDRFQFTQSGSIGQWEGTMTQDTTMSDADIATTGQRNALKILTTTVENSISADEESSYFDIYMNGLEPERYYTILIKVVSNNSVKIFDENMNFKVING